jgi:hypothetical protein
MVVEEVERKGQKKEGRGEMGGRREYEEFSSSFSSLEKLGFDITEKLFQLPNPSGTNQQEPPEQTTKEAGHSTPVKKVSQPQTPAKVSQLQTPAPVSKGARKPGAMFGEDHPTFSSQCEGCTHSIFSLFCLYCPFLFVMS